MWKFVSSLVPPNFGYDKWEVNVMICEAILIKSLASVGPAGKLLQQGNRNV